MMRERKRSFHANYLGFLAFVTLLTLVLEENKVAKVYYLQLVNYYFAIDLMEHGISVLAIEDYNFLGLRKHLNTFWLSDLHSTNINEVYL